MKNDITRCFTTCYVVISCGGKTRTCDLQVMSLASYQLLHSAILTIKFNLCCGGRMGDSLYSRVSDRNLNNIDHFWGSIFLFMVLFTSYLQNVV